LLGERLRLAKSGKAYHNYQFVGQISVREGHTMSMKDSTSAKSMQVTKTSQMPWERDKPNPITGKVVERKYLLNDPDTGMEAWLVKYNPGVVTVAHTHNCSHGIFVLEGELYTHDGTYGPGDFVWFPEGLVMEHGAVATAKSAVTGIFITNKPFNITFE
jgi:quercetin dioxygenase-like cupin family protein